MHVQDLLAALHIRQAYMDLTVKTAGAQQRGVQNVGTVGGRHHDHTLGTAEAVHLHQQLVEGLFLFVVAAAQTGATLAAHRIDLIDKDNGRCHLLGLFKQVTDTACAYTHIHFHKIGAGDG